MTPKQLLLSLITIVLFSVPVLAQSGEVKDEEVKRIQCTVRLHPKDDLARILVCPPNEGKLTKFEYKVSRNHPWAEYLNDVPEDADVVIEVRPPNEVCLMQVHRLDGLVRNPVNERLNVCLPVRKNKR